MRGFIELNFRENGNLFCIAFKNRSKKKNTGQIPVNARSKSSVYDHLSSGIVGSNPTQWMYGFLLLFLFR